MSTKHVIWDNLAPREALTLLPEHQLVMRCTHCGDRYVLALPCSLGMASVVLGQYGNDHRHCKPKEG